MTVHLLRHFEVDDRSNGYLTVTEFRHWVEKYDTLPLHVQKIDLPSDIELILCSTLDRAKRTAQEFSSIETEYIQSLIEVNPQLSCRLNIKLKKYLWFTLGTLFWYFNLLKEENRVDSKKRSKEVCQQLYHLEQQNILIISHGFFMKLLAQELIQNGFKGDMDLLPKNAKLYTFTLAQNKT